MFGTTVMQMTKYQEEFIKKNRGLLRLFDKQKIETDQCRILFDKTFTVFIRDHPELEHVLRSHYENKEIRQLLEIFSHVSCFTARKKQKVLKTKSNKSIKTKALQHIRDLIEKPDIIQVNSYPQIMEKNEYNQMILLKIHWERMNDIDDVILEVEKIEKAYEEICPIPLHFELNRRLKRYLIPLLPFDEIKTFLTSWDGNDKTFQDFVRNKEWCMFYDQTIMFQRIKDCLLQCSPLSSGKINLLTRLHMEILLHQYYNPLNTDCFFVLLNRFDFKKRLMMYVTKNDSIRYIQFFHFFGNDVSVEPKNEKYIDKHGVTFELLRASLSLRYRSKNQCLLNDTTVLHFSKDRSKDELKRYLHQKLVSFYPFPVRLLNKMHYQKLKMKITDFMTTAIEPFGGNFRDAVLLTNYIFKTNLCISSLLSQCYHIIGRLHPYFACSALHLTLHHWLKRKMILLPVLLELSNEMIFPEFVLSNIQEQKQIMDSFENGRKNFERYIALYLEDDNHSFVKQNSLPIVPPIHENPYLVFSNGKWEEKKSLFNKNETKPLIQYPKMTLAEIATILDSWAYCPSLNTEIEEEEFYSENESLSEDDDEESGFDNLSNTFFP